MHITIASDGPIAAKSGVKQPLGYGFPREGVISRRKGNLCRGAPSPCPSAQDGVDPEVGHGLVAQRGGVDAVGGLDAPAQQRARLEDLRALLNADTQLLFGDGFDMLLFTMTAEIHFSD